MSWVHVAPGATDAPGRDVQSGQGLHTQATTCWVHAGRPARLSWDRELPFGCQKVSQAQFSVLWAPQLNITIHNKTKQSSTYTNSRISLPKIKNNLLLVFSTSYSLILALTKGFPLFSETQDVKGKVSFLKILKAILGWPMGCAARSYGEKGNEKKKKRLERTFWPIQHFKQRLL